MRRSGSRSNSVAPRTLALPTPQLRSCPLLQQDKASIAAHTGALFHSTLGTASRAAPLTCQKGACILAVVPHVLQALVLHFHHSTGRMHPAGFSPACPIHARDRYADLDRRKQPALASLACTLQSHDHAMSLPCVIGTCWAFHHVLRTVSACLRESSS
jgi:hypothetical protein